MTIFRWGDRSANITLGKDHYKARIVGEDARSTPKPPELTTIGVVLPKTPFRLSTSHELRI